MMKSIATLAAAFTLSLLPAVMHAQNPPQAAAEPAPNFYHLHFAVEELNAAGQVTNTRTYDEIVRTVTQHDHLYNQQIKTGSRVPIATGSYGSNPATASTQFQYIDLGVNLEVRSVKEEPKSLSFELNASIESIARQTQIAGTNEPVIRQDSWDSLVIVPIGKPTVVFSSDDLDSTGRMQVQVTATRIE